MLNSLKGLLITLASTFHGLRDPVTREYPEAGNLLKHHDEPTPVQDRFMGFPSLTWDGKPMKWSLTADFSMPKDSANFRTTLP